jgi:hypothetical protein
MGCRRLGRSGLMVSELCLVTMTFGRELDEDGSRALCPELRLRSSAPRGRASWRITSARSDGGWTTIR